MTGGRALKVALRSSNYLGPSEQKSRLCCRTKGVFYVTSCLEAFIVCNADINTQGLSYLTLWANLPFKITICWGIVFGGEAKSTFSLAHAPSLRYDLDKILGGTWADMRGGMRGWAGEDGMLGGALAMVGDPASPCPRTSPPFLPISRARSNDTSHAAKHLAPKIPYPTPDPGMLVAEDHLPRESDASIPLVTPSSPSHGSAVPRGGRKAGGDQGTTQ